jgi:predicted RNA methylase
MQLTLDRSAGITLAAREIAIDITAGGDVTRATLNAAMAKAFGGHDADGNWSQRDSFDALEAALTIHCRDLELPVDPNLAVDHLQALVRRLPTHTVRSEEQNQLQQFSTPAHIAWLVAHLAALAPTDIVLEPSAGTGLIAAFAAPTVRTIQLNEYSPQRANILRSIFPESAVTQHDGAKISTVLAAAVQPSVVVMNPPFSVSLGRGADSHAAARHLRSALNHLARGGRLIAIMPDWFHKSARLGQTYDDTLLGCTVKLALRLDEGGYAKHGTSVAIRIYVIDQIPGQTTVTTINRDTVAALMAAFGEVPPREQLVTAPPPAPRQPKLGMFRLARTMVPRPVVVRIAQTNEVRDVAYEVLAEPAPMGEQQGVYTAYRPSRLRFAEAGEHPTMLVESSAMASISAPKPSYVPRLPERTVSQRLLSSAQLETVVYAGEAWSRDLTGTFSVSKGTVALTETPGGDHYRTGFFLGDGTGAGKGRQAAACILDQRLRGNRKHIWISKNAALLEDAKRDWTALGGLSADIIELAAWKIDRPITIPEGILFVPYGTLRSQRIDETRLDQIAAWAGPDFEGVIVFDEAHEMGGVAGGEGTMGKKDGSLQGIAGVLLQNRLPRARVLYASATGASDINNLAYAVRLGLWGPGTSFAGREQFITDIREGGIAAMELVARDLKATGLYLSRALSFGGVEYDMLRHDLSDDQIAVYNAYSAAWTIIHQNMEAALELAGIVDPIEKETLNSQAKSAARSRFESTKQRFFGQVLLSMKLPSLLPAIDEHIAGGDSVVVQIVSTAEAILGRRLADLDPADRADLDIELSPVEYVVDYLTRAFPTRQMEEYTDDQGAVHSRPMFDEHGDAVYNPEAEAARAALIEHICSLPQIHSALDAIILRFGTARVAEVTGRTKRLIRCQNGTQKLESRSARVNLVETQAFMAGDKRILIFSDAGGTGRSYHASLDATNQQRRVHFLLEPGWRADRAIQGLGRTHRTHQAVPPLFRPVSTNTKGELRFSSTIARRLDSLGALTRGQRQTGGQGMFDASDNLESDYARAALMDWYHLLIAGKLSSCSLAEFQRISGLELTGKDGIIKDDLPPIQRWLNRLLALTIAAQNAIFDEFIALVETRVSAAKEAGTYDVGVETVVVETCQVLDDMVVRTDPVTGATSHLLELLIQTKRHPRTLASIKTIASHERQSWFMKNRRSGMVALRVPSHPHMDDNGTTLARFELIRPLRCDHILEIALAESAWEETGEEEFDALWRAEFEADENKLISDTIYLATGLLLPIWGALPKDSLTVNRIVDSTGASWLGRKIPDVFVEATLRKLGVERGSAVDPAKLAMAICAGRVFEAAHPHNFTIRHARVNGHQRIEIAGACAHQIPALKAVGCFTEIIAYKTRVFVPRDQAEAIITGLLR